MSGFKQKEQDTDTEKVTQHMASFNGELTVSKIQNAKCEKLRQASKSPTKYSRLQNKKRLKEKLI